MKYIPRRDQFQYIADVHSSWNAGAQNVVGVAATGFGKTVCLGYIIEQHAGFSCVIAHRQELVSQISLTLASYGIRHNIIAAQPTIRAIAALHVEEFGTCYYVPSAPCAVASVDTLVRVKNLDEWFSRVTLWISDEGHHVVRGNKWSRAIDRFTHKNVKGLLPTATPERADGKGLGRHADGIADVMIEGPPMRWLIDNGHLTDYRIVCVESDLKLLESDLSASGDWSQKRLKEASEKSRIVGDIVGSYLQWAQGKLGITFMTDIDTAVATTAAYRSRGVRAECLTGKTNDGVRRQMLRRFENRELDQIVAVDIVSEGFDLPAIEVASFGRPTNSYGLYAQQFGRTLRTLPGKDKALIIDHVGNVLRHLPPDRPHNWTLDRREKRSSSVSDGIPMRVCLNCFEPFERIYKDCPHCGHYHEPEGRDSPAMVEGDLSEMTPEVLAALRGQVAEENRSNEEERHRLTMLGLPHQRVLGGVKVHDARLGARGPLREAMGLWGGVQHAKGLTDPQIQRLFYIRFETDVMTAQTLNRSDSEKLLEKINKELAK